jgi:tungstate transport system ATP-binding protein
MFNTTLRENVAYGLNARGIPREDVCERVDEALAAGDMAGLASARAATLSGGESQRAALVRAYALMPDAVFLDEPTASMDPDNTALAERLIMRMCEEHGATVVMVTHNLFQAKRLAGHAFFMFGGELIEYGETGRIFGRPEKELTSKYVSGEVVC